MSPPICPLIRLVGSRMFSDIVVLDGCSRPPGHVALHKLITEAVLILHKEKIFSFVISLRWKISSAVFPVSTARSSVRTRKTEGEILQVWSRRSESFMLHILLPVFGHPTGH